jgi:hypothetical protein
MGDIHCDFLLLPEQFPYLFHLSPQRAVKLNKISVVVTSGSAWSKEGDEVVPSLPVMILSGRSIRMV